MAFLCQEIKGLLNSYHLLTYYAEVTDRLRTFQSVAGRAKAFVLGKDIKTLKASMWHTRPRKKNLLETLHFAAFSRALNKFLIFNSKYD